MKAETRPDDGVLCWAYILIYVDDILCVHHDPGSPLAKLDEYFKMKEGSIQVPTFYLGAKLKNTVLTNDVVAQGMRSSKYVESAVQNVQEYLAALPGDQMLMKKASCPFAGGYTPDLYESPEMDISVFWDVREFDKEICVGSRNVTDAFKKASYFVAKTSFPK
jgi:hypothetical protein